MKKTKAILELRQLLQMKHGGLSFERFLGKTKSEILKRRQLIPRSDRDSIAKTVFINGMDDVLLKDAVKSLCPPTLKETFELVKNFKLNESSHNCMFNAAILKDKYIDELKSEIKLLREKVDYLSRCMTTLLRNNFNKDQKTRNSAI